jgi:hypothetical protein
MKRSATMLATMVLFAVAPAYAAKKIKVPMSFITTDGVGKSAGTVTISESKDGVTLATDLKGLTPGEHGFHMHEKGSCDPADKEGKKTAGQAAGGHFDPDATKAHKGPGGGGHKGDLRHGGAHAHDPRRRRQLRRRAEAARRRWRPHRLRRDSGRQVSSKLEAPGRAPAGARVLPGASP